MDCGSAIVSALNPPQLSRNGSSGPRRRESLLADNFRVARDPGRIKRTSFCFCCRQEVWRGVCHRANQLFADYLTNWSKWGATFAGILANGPQSITMWNLALDERGRPNIGPFDCGGLVQIHSETKEITRSGLYWALVHHARAFRGGAVIVASHDANGDLPAVNAALIGQPASSSTVTATPNSAAMSRVYHTAAKNSDGSLLLVLTNPGDAKEVTVACVGQTAKVALTADSITTLRWS